MANTNRYQGSQSNQSNQDWDQDNSRYNRESDYDRQYRDENMNSGYNSQYRGSQWQDSNYDNDYERRNRNRNRSQGQGYGDWDRYDNPNRQQSGYGSSGQMGGTSYGISSDWNRNRYGQGNMGGIYDTEFGRDSYNRGRGMYGGTSGMYGGMYGSNYGYSGATGHYGGGYQETSQYNPYQGDYNREEYGGRYGQPRNIYGGDTRNYGNANQGGYDRDWWDRTKDEVASWFGNDDAARRRERDKSMQGYHRGKGPRGYTRSDDRIREDINDRLSDDPFIDASDIDVKVESCNVILSGEVDSRDDKRRAEDLAERVSGVTNVENRIRVSHERGRYGSNPSSNSGQSSSSLKTEKNRQS